MQKVVVANTYNIDIRLVSCKIYYLGFIIIRVIYYIETVLPILCLAHVINDEEKRLNHQINFPIITTKG